MYSDVIDAILGDEKFNNPHFWKRDNRLVGATYHSEIIFPNIEIDGKNVEIFCSIETVTKEKNGFGREPGTYLVIDGRRNAHWESRYAKEIDEKYGIGTLEYVKQSLEDMFKHEIPKKNIMTDREFDRRLIKSDA